MKRKNIKGKRPLLVRRIWATLLHKHHIFHTNMQCNMHTSSPKPPPYYSLCLQLSDIPHEVIKICNGWRQFSLNIFPALIALMMIYDVGPLMNIKWFIITRKMQTSSYRLWDSYFNSLHSLNIFIFVFS